MSKYFNSGLGYALNIQLFGADGGGSGAEGTGAGTEGSTGATGAENGAEGKPKTLDDILKANPEFQSEVDRRMNKAIETSKAKWDATINDIVNGKLTEAQKLNNMTEAQKKEYEKQQAEKALADREKAITIRELQATAKETLVDKGLPASFATLLNYESADTVNASIEALSKEWATAIQKGVAERIKTNAVPNGTGAGEGASSMERFRKIAGIRETNK